MAHMDTQPVSVLLTLRIDVYALAGVLEAEIRQSYSLAGPVPLNVAR